MVVVMIAALCASSTSSVDRAALDEWRRTRIRLCDSDEGCGRGEQCTSGRCAVFRSSHWYGWQTLLADAIGVQSVAIGVAAMIEGRSDTSRSSSRALFIAGISAASLGAATLALGAPIIHRSNTDGWIRSIVSFVIRAASLGTSIGLSVAAATCDEHLCGLLPGTAGIAVAVVGTTVASVIDAIVGRNDPAPSGIRPVRNGGATVY